MSRAALKSKIFVGNKADQVTGQMNKFFDDNHFNANSIISTQMTAFADQGCWAFAVLVVYSDTYWEEKV